MMLGLPDAGVNGFISGRPVAVKCGLRPACLLVAHYIEGPM